EDWEEISVSPTGRFKEIPDLTEQPDWYFAPCLFTGSRRKEHALPSRLLYADLDETDPSGLDLRPSIAWETSHGRYQGIWLLDRQVAVRRKDGRDGPFEELNR